MKLAVSKWAQCLQLPTILGESQRRAGNQNLIFRALSTEGHTPETLWPGLGYSLKNPGPILPSKAILSISGTSPKMKGTVLMARIQIILENSLYTVSTHQTETWCWVGDFHNSPMKWLGPKASISSKRTRPPGAWRRVTLRPSMREHCWNPVAVTFHSKIREAVASCRILKTGSV